jgi:thiol-disulfide isomerase/thioredoxin
MGRPGMRRLAVALVGVGALTLAGCGDDGRVQPSAESAVGFVQGSGVVTVVPMQERQPAPAFAGPLLDGGDFDLAEARGDVVVLNVWGSWCAPCRAEAPGMSAVAEQTAADGVRFVGVNTRDTETAARAFEEEFGIGYPSVVDQDGRLLLAFRDTLPPAAIPSTLVVDREGRMAARVIGPITETTLTSLVTDIAAEAPA